MGGALARWLVAAGHEIAVVERDRKRCDDLDAALGSVCVLGDGTDAGSLSNAGTNRAEVFIATSSSDEVNLVACQLAKHHFGVDRTVSVVNDPDHAELFSLLGIDITVDVTEMVLGRIEQGLSSRGLEHLMPVSESHGKTLVSIKIPPESGVEGRTLREIGLPNGVVVPLVISRDGDASIPTDTTRIRVGDEVIAVATAQEEEDLRDLLIDGTVQ